MTSLGHYAVESVMSSVMSVMSSVMSSGPDPSELAWLGRLVIISCLYFFPSPSTKLAMFGGCT